MTIGDVILVALLAAVLLGFWLLGRHWSREAPRVYPKVRRPKQPGRWAIVIGWPWTLLLPH